MIPKTGTNWCIGINRLAASFLTSTFFCKTFAFTCLRRNFRHYISLRFRLLPVAFLNRQARRVAAARPSS